MEMKPNRMTEPKAETDEPEEEIEQTEVEIVMSDDEEEELTRRSTRETRPIARLEPRLIGQTYNQLEYCHNPSDRTGSEYE
jgi:hypothetical protein